LAAADRAIILTAHMGNYRLGAGLFIEKFKRKIRIVRAPGPAGQIISSQGDRVVGEVARLATNFFRRQVFCRPARLFYRWSPGRGFYPLFIVRVGFRNIESSRASPSCAQKVIGHVKGIASAMRRWSQLLEETVGRYWP